MTDPIQRSDPRPSTWENDDYDRPLPGAAQRNAANVANSPWLADAAAARAAGARHAEPYPAAIFSNPAMFGSWSSRMTPADIEAEMKKAGSNARGIVFGDVPNRDVGHFFNVVTDDGVARFVDGQTGGAARLADFDRFFLLRTN